MVAKEFLAVVEVGKAFVVHLKGLFAGPGYLVVDRIDWGPIQ